MLRPLFKTLVVAIGAFVVLAAGFNAPAKAIIIVEGSVNGGAFQPVATAPNDQFATVFGELPVIGDPPQSTGGVLTTLDTFSPYPKFQVLTSFSSQIDSLVVRATVTDLNTPAQVERLLTGYADTEPDGGLADIMVEAFIDPNNVAFGTTIPVAGGGPFNQPATRTILTQLTTPVAPLYSLTLVNTLTNITDAGNFTSTLQVVPEPGTLGLLGAGLMVTGLMLKRRRRQA